MRQALATLVLSAMLVHAAPAESKCYHHKACWKRVREARATAWLWRHYKANPMPVCTWLPESGPGSPWRRSRYRVKNWSSTAAGKYQLLDITAHSAGIPDYPGTHDAAKASPLMQEKAARRVLATQGRGAWVGC